MQHMPKQNIFILGSHVLSQIWKYIYGREFRPIIIEFDATAIVDIGFISPSFITI